MKRKLIKTEDGTYVIAVEIQRPAKKGEWLISKERVVHSNVGYNFGDLLITHSTSSLLGVKKLSLKNCEAIENGYDLDELIKDESSFMSDDTPPIYKIEVEISFMRGFQKALEIIGDKKFNEENIHDAIMLGIAYEDTGIQGINNLSELKELAVRKSVKTEWDVEIEMNWTPLKTFCDDCGSACYIDKPCDHPSDCNNWKPKLDADGCLILKKR